MKLGPIFRALARRDGATPLWIDTAQHTDPAMRGDVLDVFELPSAAHRLPSTPHRGAARLAHLRASMSAALERLRPEMLVVIGDVDGSLAAAEAAAALAIPVAHVEAGLRSGDPRMVEERNRIAIDALSGLHLVTEAAGLRHLSAEGRDPATAEVVGNPMIDALHHARQHLEGSPVGRQSPARSFC